MGSNVQIRPNLAAPGICPAEASFWIWRVERVVMRATSARRTRCVIWGMVSMPLSPCNFRRDKRRQVLPFLNGGVRVQHGP